MEEEAYPSRVVFVSVLGPSKLRRKAAVGIADGMDWDGFLSLICGRLKVPSVKAVYMKDSMAPVTSLDSLQDIDDLVIEPGEEPPPSVAPVDESTGIFRTGARLIRGTTSVPSETTLDVAPEDSKEKDKGKRMRRSSYLRRLGIRLFGEESSQELPRYTGSPHGKDGVKKKKRRGSFQAHNVAFMMAILLCTITLILLYLRISTGMEIGNR